MVHDTGTTIGDPGMVDIKYNSCPECRGAVSMKMRRKRPLSLALIVVIATIAAASVFRRGIGFLTPAFSSPRAVQVQPASRSTIPSKGLAYGYSKRLPLVESSGLGALSFVIPKWSPGFRPLNWKLLPQPQ